MSARLALFATFAVAILALASGRSSAQSAWVDGAPAPPPSQPLPYPEAPREPGATSVPLDVPAIPPEPARVFLDDGITRAPSDVRFVTERTRDQLLWGGALDLDNALVDVPGLWLRHEQAGNAAMQMRGLHDFGGRDIAVLVDGVPLFNLGGLLSPLEQLSNVSSARLRILHGPRVIGASPAGRGGVLDVDTLGDLKNMGESMGLHGVLGAGYGGADLEKGVFTSLETGADRVRFGVHATLLNREEQRLGRSDVIGPGTASPEIEPGGLVAGSSGNGGAAGARIDVVPFEKLHLFSTWHSSRALDVGNPALCARGLDNRARFRDCTRTSERGVDAWIVGSDGLLDVVGAKLVLRGRAHMQHAIANDERAGSGITVVERAFDEGVRAGARGEVALMLAPIAFGDVWTPSASLGVDVYGDKFDSTFRARSTRARDAEPPEGIAVPERARLVDDGNAMFSSVSLQLRADGQRMTWWAAGRAFATNESARILTTTLSHDISRAAVEGELGVSARIVEPIRVFAAGVHRDDDDTVELGLAWDTTWAGAELVAYGSARRDRVVNVDDVNELITRESVAYGAEARGHVVTGLDGLSAHGTFALVSVDDGPLFSSTKNAPASAVPNPSTTLTLNYAPSTWPAGFFARARALLPQQRLSPAEELDRALCPELPTDEQLAAGQLRTQPCSGASGAFLLDLGAHLELGTLRIDVVGENLLDQQGALRDEPIGFGGTSLRAMLTLKI